MIKIILISMLLASPANALGCNYMREASAAVMELRQKGFPPNNVLQIATKRAPELKKFYQIVIKTAYAYPAYEPLSLRAAAVDHFSYQMYIGCKQNGGKD